MVEGPSPMRHRINGATAGTKSFQRELSDASSNGKGKKQPTVNNLLNQKVTFTVSIRSILIAGICVFFGLVVFRQNENMMVSYSIDMEPETKHGTISSSVTTTSQIRQRQQPKREPQNSHNDHKQCMFYYRRKYELEAYYTLVLAVMPPLR